MNTYTVRIYQMYRWLEVAQDVDVETAMRYVTVNVSDRKPCKIIDNEGNVYLIWKL